MFAETVETALDADQPLRELYADMGAQHRRLLAMVAEFDRRAAWRADGAPDMAAWLCRRLKLSHATAVEWVRVAHALESLPVCASAYAQGRLSWDQVRALTLAEAP